MASINLSTSIIASSQIPLDSKCYFINVSDMSDLGPDNYKAFLYYDGMIASCNENRKLYMWKEDSPYTMGLNEEMVLPTSFEYPEGSVVNGIDYSGKKYNFFEYYKQTTNEGLGDRILDGSVYWTGIGLNFKSTTIRFKFNNVLHVIQPKSITLDPADSTNPRIDVFVVNVNNELLVKKGTPSPNPLEPSIDFTSEIRISSVFIPDNATTPQETSLEQIYDENLGPSAEWTGTEINIMDTETPLGYILFDSENNPDKNTKSIEVNGVNSAVLMSFKRNSPLNRNGLSSLFFRFLSKTSINFSINIKIYSSNKLVSSFTLLPNSYGFNPYEKENYQSINIPLSYFQSAPVVAASNSIDRISFSFTTESKTKPSFFMDDIKLIKGGESPASENSFFSINEVSGDSLKGLANKVFVVNSDETSFVPVDLQSGPQGPEGPQGPIGPEGPQGPIGPEGPQGPQGIKGDTGDAGPKGDTGDVGPKGDTGDVGPKGDKGDKGDDGVDGVDAYVQNISSDTLPNQCLEGIPIRVSRLLNVNATEFCVLVDFNDLDSELILTNYSSNPLPIGTSSSEVYDIPRSFSAQATPITSFPEDSWYRLRVMHYNSSHYFLIVEKGSLK